MDRWTTLEPVKLHQNALPSSSGPTKSASSHTKATQAHQNRAQFIGKLPLELHLLILHFLPIPDIPLYARTNRSLARLAGDERIWDRRWKLLIGTINDADKARAEEKMASLLDEIERRGAATRGRTTTYRNSAYGQSRASSRGSMDLGSMGSPGRVKPGGSSATYNRASVAQAVLPIDDDFGDFAAADLASDEFDDFVGASTPASGQKVGAFTPFTPSFSSPSFIPPPMPSPTANTASSSFTTSPSRTFFKRAYIHLQPLLRIIHASTPPHNLLSLLLPTPPPPPQAPASPALKLIEPTQQTQAQLLATLTRFLSPNFKPTRDWEIRAHALRSAGDVFDARLLKAFEDADERVDNKAMREASWAAWEVFTAWGVPRRKDIIRRGAEVGSGLRRGLGGSTAGKVEWEIGKVWIERREEFYQQGKFDPLANFTCVLLVVFNTATDIWIDP